MKSMTVTLIPGLGPTEILVLGAIKEICQAGQSATAQRIEEHLVNTLTRRSIEIVTGRLTKLGYTNRQGIRRCYFYEVAQ